MDYKNSLECPFCRGVGDPDVTIDSKKLLDRHWNDKLPDDLKCRKCGATAEKVVGCCRLRYVWSKKAQQKDYDDVARFECSDCGLEYYAKIRGLGGGQEAIGEKVKAPLAGIKVRQQRMLCGGCQGRGGMGDLLNDLLKGQKASEKMRDLFGG